MKKLFPLAAMFLLLSTNVMYAQWGSLGDRIATGLSNKAQNKVENEVDNAADKAYDKSKDAAVNGTKKNTKTTNSSSSTSPNSTSGHLPINSGNQQGNNGSSSGNDDGSQPTTTATSAKQDFKSYQNYDFVPGDKVLFEDDWREDDEGEFPAHWKLTNGEFIVNKFEGNNVLVAKERSDPDGGSATWGIMPRMKTEDYLPKEFTVELEVYALPKKKHEGWDDDINSHSVAIELLKANNDDYPSGQAILSFFREGSASTYGFPNEFNKAGLESGMAHLLCLSYKNNQAKIYLDGQRLFTIPDVGIEPARIRIVVPNNGMDEPLIIKHVRIAEGSSMNLIKKLTTDTKFIARGITFDYNKATIKPESMGEFNRISKAMLEDKTLRFEIGGHTDGDGDAAYNLKLSQQRADAVKAMLVSMGVDASRLTTKGYGKTKPISDNTTPEGKANNRRVEFVKI